MSLLDEDDAEPTLQVSPGALLSDEPRVKESKRERRKGGGLSLGRTKPRDVGVEKASKKGKHARNKSGSRTPPDSPRAERGVRGAKSQPSPNVKSHRKRYSQLGLDLSSANSEEDDEEEEQTYFTNQAASEDIDNSSQEPFFSIEKSHVMGQPTSPGPRSTVQFPVQFEEAGSALFPIGAPCQTTAEGAAQSPTSPTFPVQYTTPLGAWTPTPSTPLSDASDLTHVAEPTQDEDHSIPEVELHVSTELRLKCRKQFLELQPTHGRLQGHQARSFFMQSRLPNADLSAIWRLADMDRDNALSEQEFCVAMKLVLLRRKGYSLPTSLPISLKESSSTSHSHTRAVPQLQARQTTSELPSPHINHPALSEISHQSQPELLKPRQLLVDLSDPSTHASSVENALSTSLAGGEGGVGEEEEEEEDKKEPLSQDFTKPPTAPAPDHTSVRRARSLKLFTPPRAESGSPPHSPFSPPAISETVPIISDVQTPTPSKANTRRSMKEKSGYQTLSAEDDEETAEEAVEQLAIGRERGHGRSTSLDLNKMIASSSVLTDMPAAEPPRPPPKPVAEDAPQVRGRSASTGSISSTGPSLPLPTMDSSADALLLPRTSSRPLVPARKAPLLPPVPKPRRPPPPRREAQEKPDDTSLLRNKSELQTTIRSLKDTNATLQALNRELEEKLFALMEDRVQLAREVELARQMQQAS